MIVDALLKFKITSRQCPGDCFQQTSLCSAEGECVCRDGYVGADCQSTLSCVSQANSTEQVSLVAPPLRLLNLFWCFSLQCCVFGL